MLPEKLIPLEVEDTLHWEYLHLVQKCGFPMLCHTQDNVPFPQPNPHDTPPPPPMVKALSYLSVCQIHTPIFQCSSSIYRTPPTRLLPHVNTASTRPIFSVKLLNNQTTLCLNGTLPCVDFMDVTMGDIPYITTLCLNGTLPCVDFMDVTMGDIPYITTLCLNGTLPCVDFMDVTMGDMPPTRAPRGTLSLWAPPPGFV